MCFREQKQYFYQKQILTIAFVSAIFISSQEIIVVIIQPQIQQSLGNSEFAANFLLGQFHFGMAIGHLVGSVLSDRLGRQKAMHHSLLGLFLIGFIYSSVFNNSLLTISLAIHGFLLGVFNIALIALLFETMHFKRNQSILIYFLGRVVGSPITILFCYFTIEIMQAAWSLILAFSSFCFFLLLLTINFYVKESPLYLWSKNETQLLGEFIQYVEELEFTQKWYLVAPSKINHVQFGDFKPIATGQFDRETIGKFRLSYEQVFRFPVTGFLLYLWGVLQQNMIGGDLFDQFKLNSQFYVYQMRQIYFDDLFIQVAAVMIVGVLLELSRKVVLGVTYIIGALALLFTTADIYNTWLLITMISLRVAEPILLLTTLENYPTYSRSTALGLMLTCQQISSLFASATKVVIFALSPRFYYTILTFFLVVAAVISFTIFNTQYYEFEGFSFDNSDASSDGIEIPVYSSSSSSSEDDLEKPLLQQVTLKKEKSIDEEESQQKISPLRTASQRLVNRIQSLTRKPLQDPA